MRRVTDVESLEAIVGSTPEIIRMKEVNGLDPGCQSVLASSPVAGFGFRDEEGLSHTTVVGGTPGFARVESPTRFSFGFPAEHPAPAAGGGVSFVFLIPGVGETLRLNGRVAERSGSRVGVDLEEAYVHCAKCIRRSKLWEGTPADSAAGEIDGASRGPLAEAAIRDFLASTTFLFVSSWDAGGASDTSPKGDAAGFVRLLDDSTLAIPDRKGNKRTDTFHNLLGCEEISVAALAPGRDEILHVRGTGSITDEPELLSTMAVKKGERPPHAALIIHVQRARLAANDAVRNSKMWDRTTIDPTQAPDLNRIAAQHIAQNKAGGTMASVTRIFSKGLAAVPTKITSRIMDVAYRKDLEDEGY